VSVTKRPPYHPVSQDLIVQSIHIDNILLKLKINDDVIVEYPGGVGDWS